MLRVAACCLLVLAGCGAQTVTEKGPAPASDPSSTETVDVDFVSESAEWPTVTEKPILVNSWTSGQCLLPTVERHGPHLKPAIVVRTNPEAFAAFCAKQSPMPVGTVVLKEKHENEDASDRANEFGAMIKRAPGYDPEHGDWEYVYGSISPKLTFERGKLASCIACHDAYAKKYDYLFRSYLPDAKEVASNNSGR